MINFSLKRFANWRSAAAAAIALVSVLHSARAQSFTSIDIGTLGGNTYPTAISNPGLVAGYSYGSTAIGFVYNNGTLTNLGSLGGADTSPPWNQRLRNNRGREHCG